MSSEDFPDWSLRRSTIISFYGAGGLVNSGRAQVQHCELASISGANAQLALRVALLAIEEGEFQIIAEVPTPRFSVASSADAFSVRSMYRYLDSVADDLTKHQIPLIVRVPPLEQVRSGKEFTYARRACAWYHN